MSLKRQLLLISSSAPYGYTYLQYAKKDIQDLYDRNNVKEILFVPYALRDHDGYTSKIEKVLQDWGYKVKGIHTFKDPVSAVNSAQTIFIGGGNTFQLLKGLYDNKVLEPIRKRVLEDGIPYIGSSAGTNVATLNICTTNDMPIVQPPSFEALALVPFNINPHYVEPVAGDTHQGETREERILQYLEIPGNGPVLALREGATLCVNGIKASLNGVATAKVFYDASLGKPAEDFPVGSDLSFLFKTA